MSKLTLHTRFYHQFSRDRAMDVLKDIKGANNGIQRRAKSVRPRMPAVRAKADT